MNKLGRISPGKLPISYLDWVLHSIDSRFYRTLRLLPLQVCVFYLVLTVIIGVIITSATMALYSYYLLGEVADIYEDHIPPIEIVDHEVRVLGEEPVRYSGDAMEIIIDTSGNIEKLDPLYSQGIIVHRDRIALILPDIKPLEFTLEQLGIENLEIDAAVIRQSRLTSALLILILGSGLGIVKWGITKSIQVFMATLFIGIVSDAHKISLDMDSRFIIAVTAIVPPIGLHVVQIAFRMVFPGFLFIYLGVYAVLLIRGTRAYISDLIKNQGNRS